MKGLMLEAAHGELLKVVPSNMLDKGHILSTKFIIEFINELVVITNKHVLIAQKYWRFVQAFSYYVQLVSF